jgi:two-component system, OmpR family, response regulator
VSGPGFPSTEGQSATIFVVDDEPMLLDLAESILQPLGFEVKTFCDPQKALKAYSSDKPTLILTDYAMGSTSGMDLLKECRRQNPEQRVIMISGTVDERIYSDETAQPNCFLSKPYMIADLVKSVQALAKA